MAAAGLHIKADLQSKKIPGQKGGLAAPPPITH